MHEFYLGLAVIGGLILLMGLVSGSITNRYFVSETLIAFLFGIAVGRLGLHVFALSAHRTIIIENAARLTLGMALMATALRLPIGYPFTRWKDLAVLLGPLMVLMWLTTSLLIYVVVRLDVRVSLLIGAILTPTDPVVAASIVTGPLAEKAVPGRIRHLVSAASAANDGLGYPFVLLPILLLTQPAGQAWLHWLINTILLGVVAAVAVGGTVGLVSGWLVRWSRQHQVIGDTAFSAVTLTLAITVLGLVRIMGSDSILAVFAAGVAFRTACAHVPHHRERHVQESVARIFNLAMFVGLGIVLPWHQWLALGWAALFLVGTVLLLRQLPSLLALSRLGLVRSFHGLPDVLFVGWFGPMGISALFYSTLAVRDTHLQQVWVICTLLISASIVTFGITATPLTHLYGHLTRHATAEHPARKSA